MLRYCGWCGAYQGAIAGEGYQIRRNISEIETTTICRSCRDRLVREHHAEQPPPGSV